MNQCIQYSHVWVCCSQAVALEKARLDGMYLAAQQRQQEMQQQLSDLQDQVRRGDWEKGELDGIPPNAV